MIMGVAAFAFRCGWLGGSIYRAVKFATMGWLDTGCPVSPRPPFHGLRGLGVRQNNIRHQLAVGVAPPVSPAMTNIAVYAVRRPPEWPSGTLYGEAYD